MAQIEIVPLELAEFRFPIPALAGSRGVVMGYAVRHSSGTLLFDTGFGFGNERINTLFQPVSQPILNVLRAAGISLNEITAVANCHLHGDHAGQNQEFPGVPIYVQSREWEIAHTTRHTVLEWIDGPDVNYLQIDGECEVAPGLRLVATSGHTLGHQSLIVETEPGPVAFAGQACYSAGEWTGDPLALEGLTTAPERESYVESLERLRGLEPVRVYFGHDRNAWVHNGMQPAERFSSSAKKMSTRFMHPIAGTSMQVQKKRVNEYMHRLTVAGLGDRRERMVPMRKQLLDN